MIKISLATKPEQRTVSGKSASTATYCWSHLCKRENATLIEAIKSAKLPHDRYQTTTIVNTDDAIPGSGMFVRSSLESNKKLYPRSQFIVDSNGVARGARQLDEESSAVVVLDKDGRVQWAKDGALTQEEVQQVMDLLHKLINK